MPRHLLSGSLFALFALFTLPTTAHAQGPQDPLPEVGEDPPAAIHAEAGSADGEPPTPASEAPLAGDAEASDPTAPDEEDADDEASRPRPDPKKKKKKKKKAKKKSGKPRPQKSKLCSYRTPLYEHEVGTGEHLGLIAGRYGVLRKDVVALNPELSNPNLIRPGQKIKVCPELAPRTSHEKQYTVKAGENLAQIAKAHDLSVDELLEQQRPALTNPNLIRPGQTLVIQVEGDIVYGFEPDVHRRYDKGSLHSSHRLPKGSGYAIKRPYLAFGTKNTISLIQQAIDNYHRRANGGPLVRVGDISQKGGGPLKGHVSHQRGVDVDVGLVLKGPKKNELRFHGANEKNLDVRRTWLLVRGFLETGEVRYIFLDYHLQKLLYEAAKKNGVPESKLDEYFQYPRGRGRNHGIVRHWKGHRDHIHVRFRR